MKLIKKIAGIIVRSSLTPTERRALLKKHEVNEGSRKIREVDTGE